MRKFILATLAVAFIGCTNYQPVPQQPAPAPAPAPALAYVLIAVDNLGIPQAPVSDPAKEVIAGKLLLNADNSYEFTTTLRTQMSSAKPFTYEHSTKGRYETSTIGLHLVRSNGVIESGAFVGTNLKVFSEGVEYLFRRAD